MARKEGWLAHFEQSLIGLILGEWRCPLIWRSRFEQATKQLERDLEQAREETRRAADAAKDFVRRKTKVRIRASPRVVSREYFLELLIDATLLDEQDNSYAATLIGHQVMGEIMGTNWSELGP